MNRFLKPLFLLTLIAATAQSGDRVGNGGKVEEMDVPIIGDIILQELKKEKLAQEFKVLSAEELAAFGRAISHTRIKFQNTRPKDVFGDEKDAVVEADPQVEGGRLMKIYENAFQNAMNTGAAFRLVFHEYCRAAGIPDDQVHTLKKVWPLLDKLNAEYGKHLEELRAAVEVMSIPGIAAKPPAYLQEYADKLGLTESAQRLNSTPSELAFSDFLEKAGVGGREVLEVQSEMDRLRSTEVTERRAAMYQLKSLAQSTPVTNLAVTALIQSIVDSDDITALTAAHTLSSLHKDILPELVQTLQHPSAKVVERITDALGGMGQQANEAVRPLRALYTKHYRTESWPRIAAAVKEALSRIGTKDAVEASLQLDSDVERKNAERFAEMRQRIEQEYMQQHQLTPLDLMNLKIRDAEKKSGLVGIQRRSDAVTNTLFRFDPATRSYFWEGNVPAPRAGELFLRRAGAYYLFSHHQKVAKVLAPPLAPATAQREQISVNELAQWDGKKQAGIWAVPQAGQVNGYYEGQAYIRYFLELTQVEVPGLGAVAPQIQIPR